jgi:hypothetical protein
MTWVKRTAPRRAGNGRGQQPAPFGSLAGRAAEQRAERADRLARRQYPPSRVGYVEFNRRRGEILARLDHDAREG